MKKESKAFELINEELAKVNGGQGGDDCGKYSPKPGTHMMDDYGECFACIHDHNGKCDLR